jgi:hypothetical protein
MTPEIYSETYVAERIRDFDKIRHPHAQLRAIHRAINVARAEVLQTRAYILEEQEKHPHLLIKANPLPVISIIGPSGASKSHVIKTYHEEFSAKEEWPIGKRRVIDFELSLDATKRQFQADALAALGDPDAEKGTEPVLRRRVTKLARAKATELAFTDEVQHFIESDTEKKAKSVADAMKKTVNSGTFALVLLGTEKASQIFDASEELAQRVTARFALRGARNDVPDDIDLFIDFLRTFRTEIEERSVIKSAKTLEAPETIGLLLDQVGGRLGTTQRIMKASLRVALEQGATTLLPKHFAEAIELGKLIFGFKENLFASYASSIAA